MERVYRKFMGGGTGSFSSKRGELHRCIIDKWIPEKPLVIIAAQLQVRNTVINPDIGYSRYRFELTLNEKQDTEDIILVCSASDSRTESGSSHCENSEIIVYPPGYGVKVADTIYLSGHGTSKESGFNAYTAVAVIHYVLQ